MELKNETQKEEVTRLLPVTSWLKAGFSERQHGNMRIAPNGAPIDALARARFALGLDIPPERVISSLLTHGNNAILVKSEHLEEVFEADGLVTDEPELYLSVTAADCLPLFFVDTKNRIIGIAHAGWRGLLRGVISSTVLEMKGLGSKLEDIHTGIGPGIGVCHYEVGMQVAEQFKNQLGADVLSRRDEKLFVDLKKSAERLLGRAGIAPERIKASDVCTFCEERCFSYRRDSQAGIQAMMAVIGISS